MKNPYFFHFKPFSTNSPVKIFKWSPLMRFISCLLIVSMLNLLAGCMNYFKVRKATGSVVENMDNFSSQNKTIVLHFYDKAWILDSIDISSDSLKAKTYKEYISVLNKPVKPSGANRYITKASNNQSSVLNEVHIYTNELSRFPNSQKISVPLTSIQKIDVYEKDEAATMGSWALGIIGGSAAAFSVFMIILLLTKSSCPFIYTYDKNNYALTGEIYSGSIQPQLERNDYLKLPAYKIENHKYQLKISNEVKEIQHTNLMELWVFDHSSDLKIWVDKYGKYHTVSNLISSQSATNLAGTNVLQLIEDQDSLFYSSNLNDSELPLTDGLIMEFPKPENATQAKLMIRAKNSFVLDYMTGQFQNQFGDLYNRWNKKQSKAPAEKLRQWMFDQNIPLTLSVERNGKWESIDYYNVAGPMAFKEDILSFPLNGTENSPLKVKLEGGNFFWDIDYAGIDYTQDVKVDYRVIKAVSALNQAGKDVKNQIRYDDNRYYVQPEVGDNAIVTFDFPKDPTESQSVFLHSKGWYQILRDPSGTPDREYLETFRQPGRFNQFVNEYMQTIANK